MKKTRGRIYKFEDAKGKGTVRFHDGELTFRRRFARKSVVLRFDEIHAMFARLESGELFPEV